MGQRAVGCEAEGRTFALSWCLRARGVTHRVSVCAVQWLDALRSIVEDNPLQFRAHSGLGVQGVLDALRDVIDSFSGGSGDAAVVDDAGAANDVPPFAVSRASSCRCDVVSCSSSCTNRD